MTAQAYRFAKDQFTVAESRKWLREHDVKPVSFEAASEKEIPLDIRQDDQATAAALADPPETVEKSYEESDVWRLVPLGATSFADVEEYAQAQGLQDKMKAVTAIFQSLSSNVMWSPEITDKAAALRALVDELDGVLQTAVEDSQTAEISFLDKARPSVLQRIAGKAKAVAAALTGQVQEPPGLMIWKEGGVYRWFAVYSNKFRDQDVPPEILSAAAHAGFVKAVDQGLTPYPELLHYHVPGTRWGVADWLAFDESTGFSLASGTVDKGHEKEAEAIGAMPTGLAVSHGLEVLRRNDQDPTIIEEYVTHEISDLPVLAAANKLTGFNLLKGAKADMGIPKDKKEHLLAVGLTPQRIGEIEADLAGKAKAAEDAGLQSKEATPEAVAAAPEVTEAPEAISRADLDGLRVEMATAISQAMQPLMASQKALAEAVVAIAKSEEARIVQKAADTPALSIAAMVVKNLSAIGIDATRVGVADMALAKDKPKEAQAGAGSTGVPWIDDMIGQTAQ